jgi:hypothetical protein
LFAYCGKDSPLRSAQLYPLTTKPEGFNQNSRQVTVYDPRTEKFTFIDTCFGTQHLNFAEDDANTLWFSNNTQGKNAAVGWVNTKRFWSTGDAAASQGWTALVVDTNGNGRRDEGYNEPGQPLDPSRDTRVPALVDGRIIELRVPYPIGFFAKQIDGRDDPGAGWKGRGLWVTSGNRTPVHIEGSDAPHPGAPGTTDATRSSPLVVQFQLRPDPLAH